MVPLPQGITLFPSFLRQAGYYCTNNVKEDYNVPKPEGTWDESSNRAHWRNRRPGQPFFAVFNSTASHESQIRKRPHTLVTDPSKVRVPSYHPDLPQVRRDWAQYYDQVSQADADAGVRLRQLQEDGLEEDTIVFYFADHGSGMPRHKRWAGHSGLNVPLVVYFPAKWRHLAPRDYQPGGRSDQLINFVDLAPTVLSIAGIEPPSWMHGRAFAGPYQKESPRYLFGERGRMDECADTVRSVTDGRFVYLRNFVTHVSHAQYLPYQLSTPTTRLWRELFFEGQTNSIQSRFWQVPREPEELYDLSQDPDEVHNLAGSPDHQRLLEEFRSVLKEHQLAVRDVGLFPEGQMHAASAGGSPYDMARSLDLATWQRIVETADWASRPDENLVSQLASRLKDSHAVVRYWSVMGILMRGSAVVSKYRDALHTALEDESADVRVVAARALALYDPQQEGRQQARSKLLEWCSADRHGLFTALAALQAVEALGAEARPWAETIKNLPEKLPGTHPRFEQYLGRMKRNVLEQLGVITPSWAEEQ